MISSVNLQYEKAVFYSQSPIEVIKWVPETCGGVMMPNLVLQHYKLLQVLKTKQILSLLACLAAKSTPLPIDPGTNFLINTYLLMDCTEVSMVMGLMTYELC